MKISATSALVLNWTENKLWQSAEALAYDARLDLSEGKPLLNLFSEHENFMHTQIVSSRKFFVRNKVIAFLNDLQRQNKQGQVLILAAGLAPLSLEIAALFPTNRIFDVDKYHMPEKEKLVDGMPANISFIECDITDVSKLNELLQKEGFRPDEPTIAVLEGITYYLTDAALRGILLYLSGNKTVVVGEFGLKPELVNEKTRFHQEDVFSKIKQQVKLDFITYYSDEEIKGLLESAGYKSIEFTNFQLIQAERTGNEFPFSSPNSSWIKAIYAE